MANIRLLVFYLIILAQVSVGAAQEVRPAWQAEWEKTVKAAKSEGRLNVYPARNQAAIVSAGVFQKRYPEIKIVQSIVVGARAIQRILSERRARKYVADVHVGGGSASNFLYRAKAYDPLPPALILPEVIDESKWWLGRHHYADPEGRYTLTYIGAPQTIDIYYNSRLVNPKEFRSLLDLLNPRWKGRIVTYDMRGGGSGGGTMRLLYHHPKLGPKFIRRLFGDMDMTLTRSRRQATDWLATGKFSLCFVCSYTEVKRAKSQGLPVDSFSFGVLEGVAGLIAQGGSVSLLNRAPHPNAARVFINWLLSREGQVTAQRALAAYGSDALDSLRIDIPKDDVPPNNRRVEGVRYINLQDPSRLDMRPIYKLIGEAVRAARKR